MHVHTRPVRHDVMSTIRTRPLTPTRSIDRARRMAVARLRASIEQQWPQLGAASITVLGSAGARWLEMSWDHGVRIEIRWADGLATPLHRWRVEPRDGAASTAATESAWSMHDLDADADFAAAIEARFIVRPQSLHAYAHAMGDADVSQHTLLVLD